MANQEQLDILKQGVEAWNQWREEHIDIQPDLFEANLSGAYLRGAEDIQETPLDSASRRRRTKASEEVTRGSRKLKPITPLLKGKGFHALLLLMRLGPHGVLDTSARNDT